MDPLRRRIGAFVAVLAVLVTVWAVPSAAAADPSQVPLPPYQAADPRLETAEPTVYQYPSIAFYWEELPWDSPKLETSYLDQLYDHQEYEFGSEEHLLTAWRDEGEARGRPAWEELTDAQKRTEWSSFLGRYVGMSEYRSRGSAFEALLEELFGYTALGYQYNRTLPGVDNRGDWFLTGPDGDVLVFIEAKSGFTFPHDQARMYQTFVQDGARGIYIFGKPPPATEVTYLENLGIEVYVLPTVAVPYRHPNAPPPPGSPGTGGGPTPPRLPPAPPVPWSHPDR